MHVQQTEPQAVPTVPGARRCLSEGQDIGRSPIAATGAGHSTIICSCLSPLFNQLLNAREITKAQDKTPLNKSNYMLIDLAGAGPDPTTCGQPADEFGESRGCHWYLAPSGAMATAPGGRKVSSHRLFPLMFNLSELQTSLSAVGGGF